MAEKTVVYRVQEHVAIITLNNPDQGNIIDSSLSQELLDICLQINQDDQIYFAVISGAGKYFCTGNALEYLTSTGMDLKAALTKQGENDISYEAASAISMIECPVIAAINGDAFGQGLELALACDIRYAAENARFGFPQTAAGLMPMDGGTQRLPRLIGKGKALEMILGGDIVNSEEALGIGLISRVFTQAELMTKTMEFASGMAAKAPIAMRYVKEAVNKGMDMTLDQGVRLEADLYFLIHTTFDRTEGIKAFQEKRKPQFRGE